MRADLRGIAATIAFGATMASICYGAFAALRLHRFARDLRDAAAADPQACRPHVTVLKPLHGVEPELEPNLRSFCAQRYPAFDVIFTVLDSADPAVEIAGRLTNAYPGRTQLVCGDGVARVRNPKIANLISAQPNVRGEIVVIADSDMRVDENYLDAIVAPFADPTVGAVTAVYRGEPAAGDLASTLGAMWISEQFAPSTLVAHALEPLTHTFGSTMAVRRDVLEAIGGLAALGHGVADDHALGQRVDAHGMRLVLARYVVENVVAERNLLDLVRHELRWSRTIRSVRPISYAGIVLTYPLPLACAYLALARDRHVGLVAAFAAAAVRLAVHAIAHASLSTKRKPPAMFIPLRDVVGIAVWACAFFSRRVRWREQSLDA